MPVCLRVTDSDLVWLRLESVTVAAMQSSVMRSGASWRVKAPSTTLPTDLVVALLYVSGRPRRITASRQPGVEEAYSRSTGAPPGVAWKSRRRS